VFFSFLDSENLGAISHLSSALLPTYTLPICRAPGSWKQLNKYLRKETGGEKKSERKKRK
jgi:hypothetical protein